MTDWSAIFLGVIALAVSVMAAIQVGVVVYGARLARRVDALATQVDREIKPLLTHFNAIGEEAARATALAAAQVERVDRLFADVSLRVEETATHPADRHRRAGARGAGAAQRRARGV